MAPFGDTSTVGIGEITAVQRTTGLNSDNMLAATAGDADGRILHVGRRKRPSVLDDSQGPSG